MPPESVLDVIVRALAPLLGANMARAATRAHLEKLGIVGDKIDPVQLAKLLEAMRPGLNVFIGREKTEVVVGQVERDLAKEVRS
jgi:hypothetical protein